MSAVHPTLILGGTTKAASSALFAALGAHPGVAPSRIKETRFFLDPGYPLPVPVPFEGGLEAFARLFPADVPGQPARLWLEGTPDTLHSPGSAARLARTLPGARVAFVLREPVDRLWSWYRFARGLGLVHGGFAGYVADQRAGRRHDQPHLALAQGDYAPALVRWFDGLGRERVHVAFFESLRQDPERELMALARFAGLDPEFFRGRPFALENPTRGVRHPRLHRGYVGLGFRLRAWTQRRPRLFAALRGAHRLARPLYWRLNAGGEGVAGPSAELLRELEEHYRPAVARLRALVGDPPWPRYQDSGGARRASYP